MAPAIQRYVLLIMNHYHIVASLTPSSKILLISQYFHPESINKKKKKACFIAVTSEDISSYSTLAAEFSERSEEGQSQVAHL